MSECEVDVKIVKKREKIRQKKRRERKGEEENPIVKIGSFR